MVIERRFCGPPDSANGGYACGLVGTLLDGDVEVTLRSPPPLDQPFEVDRSGDKAAIRIGDRVIAEAVRTTLSLDVPPPVTFEEATQASLGYPWMKTHPFPRCFVCGPERAAGDGLRILPGRVEGRPIAAAPFIPDASLTGADGRMLPEMVWAALDCPSWFGLACVEGWDGRPVLLGRLAARILERPHANQRCVAIGWPLERDGRKLRMGSALYTDAGELLALARATWVVLK